MCMLPLARTPDYEGEAGSGKAGYGGRRDEWSERFGLIAKKELPIDQAQILARVLKEGKSHWGVATQLELPLGTLKPRVHLTVQKFKIRIDR